MSVELYIRRLRAADADALVVLRREALETDPLAFGASADDDIGLVRESVRTFLGDHDEQAVFGQYDGADLIGMIGLIRASKVKERHKATIWGIYVTPRARSRGVGRALLEAAIEHARGWELEQLQLTVTEAAPHAKRLYETAGFRPWGQAPRALHWKGRFVDEYHLVLEVAEPCTRAAQTSLQAAVGRHESLDLDTGNLFADAAPPPVGERAETLLTCRNLVIERIVSSAAITSGDYVQSQDEWVVLVQGDAVLEVAGTTLELRPGDYLFLRAGVPHIVRRVSEGALWLAVHLHGC